MSILDKKSVCFITGASRGIGEGLALELSRHLGPQSTLVLLARSLNNLERVQQEVLDSPEVQERHIKVLIKQFDQSSQKHEDFDVFTDIVTGYNITDEQAIMIHNAGTLEQTKYCRNLDDVTKTSHSVQLNLTGMITLNAKFLQAFPQNPKLVINMSSAASVKPFVSWGVHCAVKSARDMFFKTLAIEDPTIRVLNYAPGSVKTDSLDVVLNHTEDPGLRESFAQDLKEGIFVSPQMAVKKLIKFLKLNSFENGAHIDHRDTHIDIRDIQ